ncbi:MAG: rhodanese-like domain-containing protein [Ardenticatenia bacterium]|nr:rhodanese-like domain-containing protein [Ardenticatenia bacterium]
MRRVRWRWWTSVLVVLLVGLTACASQSGQTAGEVSKNAAGYVDITVDQLASMLENKDFVLVNVHIPYEGEIPNTDLFIPFNEIANNVDKLPDKNARIVLYCRSGRMSTIAAQTLVSLGYTNVFELDGGFNAWQASGRELLFKQSKS